MLFDINKLRVQYCFLKQVTTGVNSSILLVDETVEVSDEEVTPTYRLPVTFATARAFSKRNQSKFLYAIEVAILFYDDIVLCMDADHVLKRRVHGSDNDPSLPQWKSSIEEKLQDVQKMVSKVAQSIYFDGKYAFWFDDNDQAVLDNAVALTHDGKFRRVDCTALDLGNLPYISVTETNRSCIAFVSSSGKYAISPPVAKSFKVAKSVADGSEVQDVTVMDEDEEDDFETGRKKSAAAASSFMSISDLYETDLTAKVNISFALKAGVTVSRIFGYEEISVLNLVSLLIEHTTVNLPALPRAVKSTSPIDMTVSEAVAWVLGLLSRCTTIQQYIDMKLVLTYLTTKGIFQPKLYNNKTAYQVGVQYGSLPSLYEYCSEE